MYMKRRGGSLDSKAAFYVVSIIAVLNIIAYLSVRDWNAIFFFILAGLVTYGFDTNKTLVLVIAIVAATLFRITRYQREGMAKPTPKIPKKKPLPVAHEIQEFKSGMPQIPETDDPVSLMKEAMSGANMEGLTNKLMKNQKSMISMAQNLQPMMKQATEMMKNLPEGFLEKAMKNFN